MQKFFNILFLILTLCFFGSVYKYYSSNNIIQIKDFNRDNINEIFNNKISNLPILENDTFNVIEFNDGFSVEIIDDKPRSFWNLLKSK